MRWLKHEILTLARFAKEDGSLGRKEGGVQRVSFGENGLQGEDRTICSDHLFETLFLMPQVWGGKEGRAYFDIWVALHDLLYPRQREGRVAVIRGVLLCGVDLSPPEGREELLEGFARLDEWLLGLAHCDRPSRGYKSNQRPWESPSLLSSPSICIILLPIPILTLTANRSSHHHSQCPTAHRLLPPLPKRPPRSVPVLPISGLSLVPSSHLSSSIWTTAPRCPPCLKEPAQKPAWICRLPLPNRPLVSSRFSRPR